MDQARMGHRDRMQRSLELSLPKVQEPLQLREFGEEVVSLPDVSLQQPAMIRTPVQDLRRGQAIAFDLLLKVLRNHLRPPAKSGTSFRFPVRQLQAERVNKPLIIKALAAGLDACYHPRSLVPGSANENRNP